MPTGGLPLPQVCVYNWSLICSFDTNATLQNMSMCFNSSNSVGKCLNGGQCSLTNGCVCASACFVGNYCESNYNAVRLPLSGAIIQDYPWTYNIYILVFVLFVVTGLVNNTLALATFIRERIRITVNGIYLIFFSSMSIMLMITLLSYIMTIIRYNNSTYRLWACHIIPFVGVLLLDGSILCTVAIAVERVLLECWNFGIHNSRKRGLLISIIIIVYACGSNLDEIFIRRISSDTMGNLICSYDFETYPIWRRIDIVFSYAHVVIPCVMHLACSLCVLTTIARRKVFIGSTEKRVCCVWFRQLHLHREFLIPPICLILCILPHGILGHLLQTCIPYSEKFKLRLHISFVLLLFVPQMLTFVLYVFPNEIYFKEFQQTIMYRTMCCYCYHKQKALRRREWPLTRRNQRVSSTQIIDTLSINSVSSVNSA